MTEMTDAELNEIEAHAQRIVAGDRRPGPDEGRTMLMLVAEVRRLRDIVRAGGRELRKLRDAAGGGR